MHLRTFQQFFVFLAISCVLWLSAAFVVHSQDWEPAHHEEHACEMFSISKYALSGSIPSIPYVPHFFWTKAYDVLKPSFAPLPYYHARSPPRVLV
ncbi:DUF2607 family protein [Vibrio penaeicida]|uniref:DUF2607 family protein n=1 Tax=Vibrio penaeicida TaxID=104609 RepID=UPI000F82B6EC|nr:DUF2607 family protein [Vibrio penaeicida]RTZ25132.1 DUF2607 family protein [Vibrio penaeicida]